MSAESGIPTFRSGAGALWRDYRPEQLATPEAFANDPALVWEWYRGRIDALEAAAPNAGHVALVRIAAAVPAFSVITQNVDGLHAIAGSADVIELHGNIRRTQCTGCGAVDDYRRSDRAVPLCSCGAMLRPGVVWFGEPLPSIAMERAHKAAARADVFFVLGTSAVVYPAAGFVDVAKEAGAFVVEVNPERTDASARCDLSVRAKTGEFLPLVADALRDLG
jgi:NAD-dependent deacetylase